MLRTTALLLLLSSTAAPLAAQARANPWQSWHAPSLTPATRPAVQREAGTGGLVLAGLTGGTLGFFGGLFLGSAIGGGNRICGDDACGLEEAAYGALIGESTLLPLAIHLANHNRGNYGLSLLASAGIAVVGIAAVSGADDASPLLAVPVAQIVSSILIERATAH